MTQYNVCTFKPIFRVSYHIVLVTLVLVTGDKHGKGGLIGLTTTHYYDL